MKKEARSGVTSFLVVLAALALGGASCSHSGPTHVGDFLVFDVNCDGHQVTWATVHTQENYKAIVQQMSAAGCSDPIEYTPCKDMHCNSGAQANPFRQNITMCPIDVAQAVKQTVANDPYVMIIDPMITNPKYYGCDRCTGVPPAGWATLMWPISDGRPIGCPTSNCG